jgi:hypothetical protein
MSQPHEVLCPHCEGGNAPNALVCQWCGAVLRIPERRTNAPKYTPPPNRAYAYQQPHEVQQAQEREGPRTPCLGTTLFVLGLLGILGSILITMVDLSGANVFQAQSIIMFGLLMVAGSFLLFMLPGILIMRSGRR